MQIHNVLTRGDAVEAGGATAGARASRFRLGSALLQRPGARLGATRRSSPPAHPFGGTIRPSTPAGMMDAAHDDVKLRDDTVALTAAVIARQKQAPGAGARPRRGRQRRRRRLLRGHGRRKRRRRRRHSRRDACGGGGTGGGGDDGGGRAGWDAGRRREGGGVEESMRAGSGEPRISVCNRDPQLHSRGVVSIRPYKRRWRRLAGGRRTGHGVAASPVRASFAGRSGPTVP